MNTTLDRAHLKTGNKASESANARDTIFFQNRAKLRPRNPTQSYEACKAHRKICSMFCQSKHLCRIRMPFTLSAELRSISDL